MGKVKAMVMDMEEQFIDAVSARIGGCEVVDELIDHLDKDKCFDLIRHMSVVEKESFVYELWNDFWDSYR